MTENGRPTRLQTLAPLIDYPAFVQEAGPGSLDEVVAYLRGQLPYEWVDAYQAHGTTPTNILRVQVKSFEYLFDYSAALVSAGVMDDRTAVEDRVVAVHGFSRKAAQARSDGILRGAPRGPAEAISTEKDFGYDRGHLIGHAFGGDLYINIIPQLTKVNRGRSAHGRTFRKMERYCAQHPNTYCFARPLYAGQTAHPAAIEFGILKADRTLWVDRFPNTATPEEMAELEHRFRAYLDSALGAPPPEEQ
jgi:DNA/RNA non-specific endonuclease